MANSSSALEIHHVGNHMKYIDTFIRLIGITSLVFLLSGYSNSKDWQYVDWMAIGIWIWHEYEIRRKTKSDTDKK
jgi:hypothetical protein